MAAASELHVFGPSQRPIRLLPFPSTKGLP
jgi:hypothetical protein